MARGVVLALFGAFAAATTPGCWHNCSDADCTSEFDVRFCLSGGAVGTLDAFGVDVTIGYGWVHFDCQGVGWCKPSGSSPTLMVEASRDADAGGALWIEAVQQGSPVSLTLRVTQGGVELARHPFVPQYSTIQPNGPDCDPTCQIAHDSATVDL